MGDGIIFGQRGQGLLTSGRGMIFGRRGALDPLVATYDAILDTDPAVPVMFQLTEYRGQQVLWQDPECTIPVEEIGDPIGGVRHPETGEILVVQETDADRPAWGGIGVGAEFDKSQHMEIPGASFDFVQNTGLFRIVATISGWSAGNGGIVDTVGFGGSGSGFYLRTVSDRVNIRIIESGSIVVDISTSSLVPGEDYKIEARGDGDSVEILVDGSVHRSTPFTPFLGTSSLVTNVGRLQVNNREFIGKMKTLFIADLS